MMLPKVIPSSLILLLLPLVIGVTKVLANLAKLHSCHRSVRLRQMTGLTLIHSRVVIPRLTILLAVFIRLKRKNGNTAHLAVSRSTTKILYSGFSSQFFNTIGALVNTTTDLALSLGPRIELNFAVNAVLLTCSVYILAQDETIVKSSSSIQHPSPCVK